MKTLDLKGLSCPIPLMRVKKAYKSLTVGEGVQVVFTDKSAVLDILTFLEGKGVTDATTTIADGVYTIAFNAP